MGLILMLLAAGQVGDSTPTLDRPPLFVVAVQDKGDLRTDDYETVYKRAKAKGCRLVVLVAAKWCAPCREAKRQIGRTAISPRVEFCIVDYDADRKLARKIMQDVRRLPVLVVYDQVAGRWVASRHSGLQSRDFYHRVFAGPPPSLK